MFYTLVAAAVRALVEPKKRFPPWFRSEIRHALKLKQAAFERLKRHPTDPDCRADFVCKRANFKSLSCQGYTEYLKSLSGDFVHNPKRFWSFVRCFKQSKGLPVLKNGEVQVTDNIGKANLLNATFASKFSDPAVTHFPDNSISNSDTLSDFAMSEELVRRQLQQLVVAKACGPDGLSARILRECANELAIPLCMIFKKSLRHGIFPEHWSEANVVLIFKKGDRSDPGNYRSVSLLPLCAKVFEKIITEQLYQHVSPHLSPNQHGFIRNWSCATNLACFLSHDWTAIKNQAQLNTVYTDFSSALQSVNHRLLLHKLEQI